MTKLPDWFKNSEEYSEIWNPEKDEFLGSIYIQQKKEIFCSIDVKNKNILDLACGQGRFTMEAIKNGADKVTANDISEFMTDKLKCSKINMEKITTTNFDITDNSTWTKFQEKFDIILFIQTLVHISNYESLFYNIKNLLKEDGILIIDVTNKSRIWPFLKYSKGLLNFQPLFFSFYIDILKHHGIKSSWLDMCKHMTEKEFKELLTNNNFEIIRFLKHGNFDPIFFSAIAKFQND